MSGLAPAATLLSVQIFSMGSGGQCTGAGEDPCAIAFESDLIAGLQWVLSKKDDYAIAAVNMSLAGPTSPSAAACDMSGPALKAAVDPLVAVDIAVIAPAGNSGLSGSLSAPGCLSSVVSVGAVNASDVVASFSNSATFLDLLAPGAPVSSSVPGGGFLALSGTSMATPHVAASWALIRSVADPSTTNAEILATLASTGLPITDSFGVTKPRIETWGAVASYAPGVPIGSATPGLLALALLAAAGVGFERRSKRR
jgi:subtilisin family serine protease